MTNRWLVLCIVSGALFLIAIDMTVLHTALPRLTYDLGASNSDKLWLINAYSLVMAGLLPGFGTLGDRIGHRRIFIWGLAVFGIASALAAFAPTAQVLIAARALLAAGAAMMMPATISLLRVHFTDDHERAIAIGIWGAISSGAAAIGPLVGGVLLHYFWWGSVFLINVPVVIVTLILTWRYIPPRPGNPTRHWDALSSVLIMVGLVGVIQAIKEAVHPDVTLARVAFFATLGAGFLWLFLRRQRGLPAPLIDFTLFRSPRFSIGVSAALVASIAMMGMAFVFAQQLQLVRGYSPLQAGLFILPVALAALVAGPLAGALLMRIGIERMLALGLAVTGLGLALFTLGGRGSEGLQIAALAVIGFGGGAAMSVASTAIMMSAPEDKAGMAGSMEAVAYEFGGTLGVAVLGSVVAMVYTLSFLPPEGFPLPPQVRESIDMALIAAESMQPGDGALLTEAARQAYDRGATFTYWLAAGMTLALAAAIAFLARKSGPEKIVPRH